MVIIHVNRAGKSLGQFAVQAVSDGLSSGNFLPDDLGWKEGMTSWQALSTFGDLPPPRTFPESASGLPAVGGMERDFQVPGKIQYGECFRKAWSCFQQNWVTAILGVLIFFTISAVIQIPMQIAQPLIQHYSKQGNVPPLWVMIVGGFAFLVFWLISFAISAIFPAGFMYFFIEALRTKQAKLADIFRGFREGKWIQLLLAVIVWTLGFVGMGAVLLGPGIYLSATMESAWPVVISTAIFAIPLVYLSIGLSYVLLMIVDRNLGFWAAIVTSISTVHRQWFRVFGLLLLVALVTMSGVLACCVGLLVTIPIGYLMFGQSYRQLFGDPVAFLSR